MSRVLISAPYLQAALERFRGYLEERGVELVVPPVSERLDEEELLPLVGDVDGVIAGDDRFTERVLAAAPRLRVISKWGTGIDSIDADACRRRGITLLNVPGAFTAAVADSVLGYVLCFARRLVALDRQVRGGSWQKLPGIALHEAILGIVGIGAIGSAVARRAHAFGMHLLGTDIVDIPDELVAATGLEVCSLDQLLARADFVSLNCDLNPTSFHLIDGRALALMKPGAVLINTARGPVVDEPALVEALRGGRLAGAALDVFEQEPLPADSPLRSFDNVLFAPHNANASPSAWEHVHRRSIEQLLAALEEEER